MSAKAPLSHPTWTSRNGPVPSPIASSRPRPSTVCDAAPIKSCWTERAIGQPCRLPKHKKWPVENWKKQPEKQPRKEVKNPSSVKSRPKSLFEHFQVAPLRRSLTPCGELPSFALLTHDLQFFPLGSPGGIHRPALTGFMEASLRGDGDLPASGIGEEPVLRSLVTCKLKPSNGDILRLATHRRRRWTTRIFLFNPRQNPKRLSPRIG